LWYNVEYEVIALEWRLYMSTSYKVLWVIGLLLLLSLFSYVTGITGVISRSNIDLHFWVNSVGYFFFGIYLSLLFINKWTLNINKSLLLSVCIPCLIFGLYTPIAYTINDSFSQLLIPLHTTGISSLIGGYAIMRALFNNSTR
jgi:hypothetical protein